MKLRAIAVLLLLATFGADPQRSKPEELYAEARLAFNRGYDEEVLSLARAGQARFGRDPKWRELFAMVAAESGVRTGNQHVLEDIEATPRSADPEAAVRRLMARGYALTKDGATEYAKADALAARVMPSLRAEIALRRATPAFYADRFDDVERFSRQALDLVNRADQPYVLLYANGMLATAAMRKGEYQQAIEHFDRSVRLAKVLDASGGLSRMLGNAGWACMRIGEAEEASARFQEAVSISHQQGDLMPETTFLGNTASALVAQRRFPEALRFARQSVAVARKLGDHLQIAMALSNLAQVEIELRQFDVARKHNDEARALWPRGISGREERYTRLNAARIDAATGAQAVALSMLASLAEMPDDPQLRWNAQAEMADVYVSLGQFTDAERMFQAALDTGDLARAEQDDVQTSYLFAFESLLIRFYDSYIDFLLRGDRVLDALQVAERSRARTLLRDRKRARVDPVALARAHDATILSYWLAPARSLLWVVNRDGAHVIQLPPGDSLDREIDAYRHEIDVRRSSIDSVRGARLFQTLVAPALRYARSQRFIVIPDGHLGAMNLETLIVAGAKPHFWIEDATVSYAPSLAFIRTTAPGSFADARALVMGNVPAQGPQFPALPHAKAEMEDVARHFGAERCEIIDGERAKPSTYLTADLRRYSYLHFVAHGTASVRSPLESSVVLAGDKLTAQQIIDAPLSAELVTVSSCNSTGRRSYAGEGPVGLAWAFLRAGARRVVASQWDVSDGATRQVMEQMYDTLENGSTHAEALRQAKLDLVHSDGKYNRPFYWAPFILYGAP